MSDSFQFELVTPERLAVSQAASMVEIPGEMGDFGVLAGHAPFFSMLRAGVVRVHDGKTESPARYFVPSGYAEVNPEGCTLLVELARDLASVTREQAQAERDEAHRLHELAAGEHEKAAAAHKLQVADQLIEAL
jgi:F-type H+-transporting ATPase subunit epsilon